MLNINAIGVINIWAMVANLIITAALIYVYYKLKKQ